MTPEYYVSLMRLIFLVAGGLWIFGGLLVWLLKGIIEDGGTFIFWLTFHDPYITSAQGRLEHAMFVSKVLLLFGIPTFAIAVFLPDPILQEWGVIGIGFCIFGNLFLRLIFMADAEDREAHRAHMSEGEAERIRKLEEEGKLRD